VNDRSIDLEKLAVALRRLSRGKLLILAERAVDVVPRAKLRALLGDMVQLDEISKERGGAAALASEVRKFHAASLRGDYYEDFAVNSKNFMDKSEGTETFIAEFDRLVGRCVRAAAKPPRAPLREAFALLFDLLRRIDEDPDSVIFFSDEAGSWQVGVDWRVVLPAFFGCLAEGTPGEDFAREVDRVISEFAEHERPRHLAAARRVSSAEQNAALRRLPAQKGKR
jgi:hypothetical protein